MAIKKGKHFSGVVGTVVVYELNGKECMRSLPVKYPKTEGTKVSGLVFGQSSAMAARLRTGLHPILLDINDSILKKRFHETVRKWLENGAPESGSVNNIFSFIDHFQFNDKSLLGERLVQPLIIDWDQPEKIVINIPELVPTRDIAAPAFTETVHWIFGAAACTVERYTTLTSAMKNTFDISYNENVIAAERIELPFTIKSGELAIVTLALTYTINKNGKKMLMKDRLWMPAGIIGYHYKKK